MNDENWTEQEIQLAKVIFQAWWGRAGQAGEIVPGFCREARAAIAHLAAQPPAMTARKRLHILQFCTGFLGIHNVPPQIYPTDGASVRGGRT